MQLNMIIRAVAIKAEILHSPGEPKTSSIQQLDR